MTYYPAAESVGEGIWSMLENAFGDVVIPVKFSPRVKSDLSYDFIAIVESGRYWD